MQDDSSVSKYKQLEEKAVKEPYELGDEDLIKIIVGALQSESKK